MSFSRGTGSIQRSSARVLGYYAPHAGHWKLRLQFVGRDCETQIKGMHIQWAPELLPGDMVSVTSYRRHRSGEWMYLVERIEGPCSESAPIDLEPAPGSPAGRAEALVRFQLPQRYFMERETKSGTRRETMEGILTDAFGVPSSEARDMLAGGSDKIEITCTQSQFARFIVLRCERSGGTNGIRDLAPELVYPRSSSGRHYCVSGNDRAE